MKLKKPILFASLATVIYLPTISVNAEELTPIIVTATRSAQSTVTTPSSISIITSEDIEQSGATHIAEILNSHASIQINDLFGNGSRATISMRGFASNANSNVQILVDGRRLNNPDLASADLSSISLKDVKQIEIIQGSAGTLYGDQAVGGVINIITRNPEKSSSYVELEVGSYNKRNLRGSVSDKKDNLSYRLSVEQLSSDNYRRHNKQDYQNILGRIDYKLANSHLFFDYQLISEELEFPGSLTKAEMLADPQQASSSYPDDLNDGSTNITRIGFNTTLSKNWNFESELTQRESDVKGKSYSSDFTQKRNHNAFTPRLIGALPGKNGDTLITIGIDYNNYDYDFKNPDWFINTVAKEVTSAVYVQSVIPLSEKLTFTLGGRHAKVDYNITDASAFPGGTNLNDDVNVFEAGLSFKLTNNSRLFARIDENYRFAKIDENTYTSLGVASLNTQKGQSIELGSEWKNTASVFNVMAYSLKLDNEIDFDSGAADPFGGTSGANVNLEPTTRMGMIIEAKHQFSKKASINIQYNYIDGSFEGGAFNGKTIPFVAKHNLTLNGRYKINKNWSTYAEARYTSERYQASDYANTFELLPALTLLNLQLQYQMNNWLASLRINNISDEKYSGFATFDSYYPSPERNIMAKVKYNF